MNPGAFLGVPTRRAMVYAAWGCRIFAMALFVQLGKHWLEGRSPGEIPISRIVSDAATLTVFFGLGPFIAWPLDQLTGRLRAFAFRFLLLIGSVGMIQFANIAKLLTELFGSIGVYGASHGGEYVIVAAGATAALVAASLLLVPKWNGTSFREDYKFGTFIVVLFASLLAIITIHESRNGLGHAIQSASHLSNPFARLFWGCSIIVCVGSVMLWRWFPRLSTKSDDWGWVEVGTHNGMPSLSWSQHATSRETLASVDQSDRYQIWLWGIAFGGALGLASGRLDNAIMGAMLAAFLGGFWLRGAGTLTFQGGALQPVPYVKTDADRREEITPISRREDCQAFLHDLEGTIYFCLARGDKSKGTLPLVDCVPWDSFSNFEEGSHKQWFRSRGAVDERLDWGVIIAQSSEGRILRVAESVDDHAWLIELLVKLQNTFIAPREAILKEFRAANAAKSDQHTDIALGKDVAMDTPVTPF